MPRDERFCAWRRDRRAGCKKVINAATLAYYPPFEFKDPKSNELTGFDHDLFEAMAKKLGAEVKWSEFSFADLVSFAPLKTGRVDIYASGAMTDTPERLKTKSALSTTFMSP
ncbi:transporter substrate-binding domain-containing protein [Bradyrhizobium tunisiense]|uniref:transporter substrate-binding domain-containing protein n=1 Tax=Bradyrhizobium tunisiense TaxID=3278709 RepID=UPI0035DFCF8E